jgi:NhaA family Na+:H+ antiporter
MSIFFLLVGLEIKREIFSGELLSWRRAILPVISASGGIVVPALMYVMFVKHNAEALHGWAIPTATDIAFAIAGLSLLGPKVVPSLKIFLKTIAIIDDIFAIAIIALFYTADLFIPALGFASVIIVMLAILNRFGIFQLWPYLLLGLFLWICILKSGIHATISGVILAFLIPDRVETRRSRMIFNQSSTTLMSPLRRLEYQLQPLVAYVVVPIFGLANVGLSLKDISWSTLWAPVPLGVAVGLFIGKQVGVFWFARMAISAGFAEMPKQATFTGLYGVSILCGIGFTMSLFIGSLAFSTADLLVGTKIGVFLGSVQSLLLSFLWFHFLNTGRQELKPKR